MKKDLIVFSHLRWHSVTQRPQHIINHFSKSYRVHFIEEPVFYKNAKEKYLLEKVTKNVTVVTPINISLDNKEEIGEVVDDLVKQKNIQKPLVWFYSPNFIGALPFIDDYEKIVYDCMDELSGFRGAHSELAKRERILLKIADVVFTGGKSLYELKKKFNKNTYCFPSSVDAKHFRKALEDETKIPDELKDIKKPIIGFYGVIDERIDYSLLEAVAKKAPEYSFVMIGPVVKVTEEELAKAPNIFYLGKKDYEDLPNYLKGFDICMMPFALNEATKFISPTKTLEYIAAEKPIISTAIKDVKRDYSHVVKIVNTPEEFLKGIKHFLKEGKAEKAKRVQAERLVTQKNSWKKTAKRMSDLIKKTMARTSTSGTSIYKSERKVFYE